MDNPVTITRATTGPVLQFYVPRKANWLDALEAWERAHGFGR